jgi:hypothetical protein
VFFVYQDVIAVEGIFANTAMRKANKLKIKKHLAYFCISAKKSGK